MIKILVVFVLLLPIATATDILVYNHLNITKLNYTLRQFDVPSYVPSIVFFNQSHIPYCGFAFFSGKIQINLKNDCEPYLYEIIQHELKHTEMWKMSRKEAIRICLRYNLTWGSKCWEAYANYDI